MADGTTASRTLTDVLLEQAGVGLCLVAPDGRVARANREWLRSIGSTLEQVLGESVVELFPGSRETALALHARARAGHRVEIPRHARSVNGHETWWEGSIAPVAMDGGTGLLLTAREVERPEGSRRSDPPAAVTRANQAWFLLTEAMPQIVCVLTPD